jgi:hypothetical protein
MCIPHQVCTCTARQPIRLQQHKSSPYKTQRSRQNHLATLSSGLLAYSSGSSKGKPFTMTSSTCIQTDTMQHIDRCLSCTKGSRARLGLNLHSPQVHLTEATRSQLYTAGISQAKNHPPTLSSGLLAYSLGTSKGKPFTMASSMAPTVSRHSRCFSGTACLSLASMMAWNSPSCADSLSSSAAPSSCAVKITCHITVCQQAPTGGVLQLDVHQTVCPAVLHPPPAR